MRSTRIVQYVNAPRERVYRALVDADAIAGWKTSDGMSARCIRLMRVKAANFEFHSLTRQGRAKGNRRPTRTLIAGDSLS